MDAFPHPPSTAAADETSVSDSTAFSKCEQGIEAFAAQGGRNNI